MTSLILGLLLLQDKTPKQILVPAPPLGSNSAFQTGVREVSELLSTGDFAGATNRAKNLPMHEFSINVEFKDINADTQNIFQASMKRAIEEWESTIPGLKISVKPKPNLKIEVVSHFSELGSDDEKSLSLFSSPDPSDPALEAVLALNRTSKNIGIAPDSMYTEVRFIIGRYLGIENSPIPASSMFRVEGFGMQAMPIDSTTRSLALKLLSQADQLRAWAKSKTKVVAAFPEVFFPSKIVDLGTITQGDSPTFQFEVRNRGKGPLHFAVRPDCSCFIINYEPVVAPGQVGIVTINMSTIDFQGTHDKGLYVYTDDAENPVTRVSVRSVIRPAYRMIQEGVRQPTFMMTPEGLKINFLIFADDKLPFEPRKATLNGISAVATITPWEGDVQDPEWFEGVQHRKGYRVSILASPSAAVGRNLVALLVQTDSKLFPVIAVNFYVQKGIAVNPGSIFYGDVTTDISRASVLLITPNANIEVLEAKSTDSRFTAKLEKISDTQYRLTVDFRPGKEKGTILTSITVKTTDPDSKEIIIPIQAYVP
jgi:hypothetical protein